MASASELLTPKKRSSLAYAAGKNVETVVRVGVGEWLKGHDGHMIRQQRLEGPISANIVCVTCDVAMYVEVAIRTST